MKPWTSIALTRTSLELNIIVNFVLTFLAGKTNLLKDFIGINSWQDNWIVAKKALKLLNNVYKHYYKERRVIKKSEIGNNKKKYSKENEEILMPFDVYTSKVQKNISLLISNTKFRSKYMQKIDKNIDIINKLLYTENRSTEFVAKWMRIPHKIFIKSIKSYLKWIDQKALQFKSKFIERIERLQNIKGLIQIYLGLNKGRWVNSWNILNFIQPCNL